MLEWVKGEPKETYGWFLCMCPSNDGGWFTEYLWKNYDYYFQRNNTSHRCDRYVGPKPAYYVSSKKIQEEFSLFIND